MGRLTAFKVGLTAMLLVAGAPAGARAGLIYVEGSASALATLDPTTGAMTEIGPTSVLLYGLGFDDAGKLYGLGADRNLYGVNTSTAALTLIGSYTGDFNSGASMGSASDGTLYSVNGVGDIWTVNPTSGAATPLGNMGFATNSDPSGDAGSGLYIIGGQDLIKIDRATGAGSPVGTGSYNSVIFGLAYTNNTMYAIEGKGPGIYAVDLASGHSEPVSSYSTSVVGTVEAAAAINSASVPEPSSLVMVLSLLPVFGGWVVLKRGLRP
jgi:hypothetical protein